MNALHSEKIILGTILRNPEQIRTARAIVKAEHFEDNWNRVLYGRILEDFDADLEIDPFLIADRHYDDRDGAMVTELVVGTVGVPTKFPGHCRAVRDAYGHREAKRLGLKLAEGQSNPADVVAEIQALMAEDDRPFSMQNAIRSFTQELQDKVDGKEVGLRTPWPTLDGMLHGMNPGELIVLAAEQGVGKSAIALNIAKHVALNGKRVVFNSLEMTETELVRRLVSDIGGVSMTRLTSIEPTLTEGDYKQIGVALKTLNSLPIIMRDKCGIDIDDLYATNVADKPDLIVIDHLHIVERPKGIHGMADQIAYMTRRCKGLAKEADCPVLLLAQLNREGKKRGQPTMSDLYGSSAIEQDANAVILLHNDPEEGSNLVGCNLAKNRKGNKGMIGMEFYGQYQRFMEAEYRPRDFQEKRGYAA